MIFSIQKRFRLLFLLVASFLLSSCATYYKQNEAFNKSFESGDMQMANKHLDANKKLQSNRNRVLYLVNKGTLAWMQQDYTLANTYFNEADLFIEDQRKNWGSEALAIISNPSVKPYKPEDFENVLINYYKAIAYLQLGKNQEALVECRRVNEKLFALNDKYPRNHKNRYSDDAFAHNLMGMIYDASKDYNNAFIAYRNAYNIYKTNYTENFGTLSPEQLKKDILRTAKRIGFEKEYNFYSKEFGMTYESVSNNEGDIIFIWMNGLGPIKDEWSINFAASRGAGGILTLANNEEGVNFPFNTNNLSSKENAAFKNLDFVRVAFPKYKERVPLFNEALIEIDGIGQYNLEKAEDVNAIAFKCLKDRMIRELANSILRLATKKALEEYARSKDDTLGTLLSIANALTEKADTRNWQTLPHGIYYTRIKLKPGNHKLILNLKSGVNGGHKQELDFNVKAGTTEFFTFQNLETK
ncbi:COG3014 family protein [Ancylomarina sp. YFZ004]